MPHDGRRRAALLLAVGLAHLAVLWVLRGLGVWKDRGAATARAPLQVVLLAPPGAALPGAPPARPVPRPPSPAAPARPPSRAVAPEAPAPQSGAFVAPLPASAAAAAPPAAAPAPSPPPLVLDLPRGASAPRRSPALDDTRAQSVRATLESRIATATGEQLVEEDRGNGVRRFRRGTECVDVLPNRDGQLDPFNESFAKKPGTARPC